MTQPTGQGILELVALMTRLRQECPWDARQTHASLVEYLIEEAYEVVEAIEAEQDGDLREELGDLLLQVVFHAQIAQEQGEWDIDDVADGICTKLIARHPHVFADSTVDSAEQVERNWHAAKAQEKGRSSVTDGIPASLPALVRAAKVQSRSAHLSLPEVPGYAEAAATVAEFPAEQDYGDHLLALVAAGHARGWDAESAVRAAVRRRIARIREIEDA
jgi:XTP/dITP diphosphohydrolase